MHIEVDQSGKIEQTEMDTVVAFRNKEQYTVLLRRKTKTEIYLAFLDAIKNEKNIHVAYPHLEIKGGKL